MRVSAAAFLTGAAGSLMGGALIGRWALGLVMIALSAGLAAWGLLRDDGEAPKAARMPFQAQTLAEVLERAWRAP